MYSPLTTITLLLSLTTTLISAAPRKPGATARSTSAVPVPTNVPPSRLVTVSDAWHPTAITNNAPAAVANVSIVLPPPLDPNKNNDQATSQSLNDSLPYLLAQLGVDHKDIPGLVAEAIPLFSAAVVSSTSGDNSVHARGLFSDIGNWVKKVVVGAANVVENVVETAVTDTGCGIFATGALPGYLVSADLFRIQNLFRAPYASSLDQDFYISPLHGSVSHLDNIRIYYSASFPPGFGSAAGVTMGRNIYLRAARAADYTTPGFKAETTTLLHEFTHVKQYQALGYNLSAFGLKYLFEYCKAGFSYRNDALEVQAYNTQVLMDKLLVDPIGFNFIKKWHVQNLIGSLGLPVARTYNSIGFNRYSLAFQKGTMVITCSGTVCS